MHSGWYDELLKVIKLLYQVENLEVVQLFGGNAEKLEHELECMAHQTLQTSGFPERGQSGCYNLVPVFDWICRCIISIFLVFAIAFLPLFLEGSFFHNLIPCV